MDYRHFQVEIAEAGRYECRSWKVLAGLAGVVGKRGCNCSSCWASDGRRDSRVNAGVIEVLAGS